jgi:hypothetical protein
MNYVGIDIHKRYSVLAAQDQEGRKGNVGARHQVAPQKGPRAQRHPRKTKL